MKSKEKTTRELTCSRVVQSCASLQSSKRQAPSWPLSVFELSRQLRPALSQVTAPDQPKQFCAGWQTERQHPEQHCPLVKQSFPSTKQLCAWAAGGAVTEIIAGRSNAEIPMRRTRSRRETPSPPLDTVPRSCSRWNLSSCCKASQTTSSFTGDLNSFFSRRVISVTASFPSQRFQTEAAVEFRQCALSRLRS